DILGHQDVVSGQQGVKAKFLALPGDDAQSLGGGEVPSSGQCETVFHDSDSNVM
ncbi:uncharacterized protein METZ01_LOCUS496688, partial [marine metagenome]